MTSVAEDVRTQIAALLAKGVLAHWQRMKRSDVLPVQRDVEVARSTRPTRCGRPRRVIHRPLSESGRNRLEVSVHSRPTVHAG